MSSEPLQLNLSAWMELPKPLQFEYFDHARREAEKIKEKLLEQRKKFDILRKHLKFHPLPDDDQKWLKWKIVAVDGSYSTTICDRVGLRLGVYQAGYLIFEGRELKGEKYWSGVFIQDQDYTSLDVTRKILELLCTRLERQIALDALTRENPDLILIDGSFFGFRVKCEDVKNVRLPDDLKWSTGKDLVNEVRDYTLRLLNSMKAIGIVKRTRTCALDGWLIYKYGSDKYCIGQNDRAILQHIMPENTWFAYKSLFGIPNAHLIFTRIRGRYRLLQKSKKEITQKDLLSIACRHVNHDLKRELGLSLNALPITQYYIKARKELLPLCIETHEKLNVVKYLGYLKSEINPSTGLPFPIDLIDSVITLPSGFTKEFLEEIEGILLKEHNLDPSDVTTYFKSINPQKEE